MVCSDTNQTELYVEEWTQPLLLCTELALHQNRENVDEKPEIEAEGDDSNRDSQTRLLGYEPVKLKLCPQFFVPPNPAESTVINALLIANQGGPLRQCSTPSFALLVQPKQRKNEVFQSHLCFFGGQCGRFRPSNDAGILENERGVRRFGTFVLLAWSLAWSSEDFVSLTMPSSHIHFFALF